MDLSVVTICFALVFLGELPDKTMFANLVMATHGQPGRVWLGAAAAFVVHAAIAVSLGVALVDAVPRKALQVVVALTLAGAAAYAWREAGRAEAALARSEGQRHGAVVTAFVVIFVAEWGDLTQILTADLAARYHSPLAVGTAAVLALWSVAGIAVLTGHALARRLKVTTIRKLTAVVLVALAVLAGWQAAR